MEKENKSKVKLPEGVTEEDIKAFKEKYGQNKVMLASLPLDDDGNEYLEVVVTVPTRKVISEFEKWVDKNPDKAKEIMVNACLLTSKERVKTDDGLFLGAFDAISKIMPVRTAIIKNL